jgi:dTDP-glucose 4,6-dehydratase
MHKSILITGGAGFIGSHVVRHFVNRYPEYRIVNLDALTYAGNLANLADVEDKPNYHFVKGDIADKEQVEAIFGNHGITDVIHLAAESHVDRSITHPLAFIQTNVMGTANLLTIASRFWKNPGDHLFYQVSTDEVYGSLGPTGKFTETTAYDPRSPYSASKASADHFVRAYGHTYGLPAIISNCSNNYGPFQFPEKLIPLMIHNILNDKELPVYGDGSNIRDWLWVGDHVDAIDRIFHSRKTGETYNIGGNCELSNLQLVHQLCDLMDHRLERTSGSSRQLIRFVKDRPGHDQRYAIDASRISRDLGWQPLTSIETGLDQTIGWYLENQQWLENVTSGAYLSYYKNQYSV